METLSLKETQDIFQTNERWELDVYFHSKYFISEQLSWISREDTVPKTEDLEGFVQQELATS